MSADKKPTETKSAEPKSTKQRYLTKSRFKIGHECPSKLFYQDNSDYANEKLHDKFLQALAEGGFQIGELAKLYYEGGTEITERDHQKAHAQTLELLQRENVIIYEAAVLFENLFIKVDVLEKKNSVVRLIEVKAKSWRDGDSFTNKKGNKITSDWEPYIADIAFQTYVARKALPQFKIQSYLCLADKDKKASIDGLHQKFFLKKDSGGRASVEVVAGTTKASLGSPILKTLSVEAEVELFISQDFDGKTFSQYVTELSKICSDRSFGPAKISRACGGCEFKVPEEALQGQQSGFVHCWTRATNLSAENLREPMIFDIWNLHFLKKEKLLAEGRYFMREVEREDLEPEDDDSQELTAKQRRWKQVDFFQNKTKAPYFDKDHFMFRGQTKDKWKAPYNFIDFETITSAIPFNQGMRPYETIAFQFSHHTVDADGTVTHQAEYINTSPGVFPNFDFLRALKITLEKNQGSVFRYSAHENTVLNHIRVQLLDSKEADKDALISFIETLTVRKVDDKIVHQGARCMVDLCELVKKYYYSPLMRGSNSIKRVLPSVLHESQFLKNKYSKAIYGAPDGIKSHNFHSKAWCVVGTDGVVADPYKSLEPIFSDVDPQDWERIERIFTDEEIKEGGAASTAYARMQFTRMSDQERTQIAKALLRYCELDTLAMVMIWEYWTQELILDWPQAA